VGINIEEGGNLIEWGVNRGGLNYIKTNMKNSSNDLFKFSYLLSTISFNR
jgi:hypothetical protein